jgi:hypothetical protein
MLLLDEPWPKEILDLNERCEVHDANGTLITRRSSLRMGIHRGTPACKMDMFSRRMDYHRPHLRVASPSYNLPCSHPNLPPLRIMTSLPTVSLPPAPILSNEIILDHFPCFYTFENCQGRCSIKESEPDNEPESGHGPEGRISHIRLVLFERVR